MSMLSTLTTGFRRLRVTSTTDTSFPTRTLTATKPDGIGNAVAQTTLAVIPCWGEGISTQKNRALVIPFGAGADDTTFDMRLYSWFTVNERDEADPNTLLYYPMLLGEINVTLSTQTGVAGKCLVATDRLADTLTIASTSANQAVSIDVVSDANNTGAHLVVDLKGGQWFEAVFDLTGATNANALVAFY